MSARKGNGEFDQSCLRSFFQPPAELQNLIERVAEHVAQHGPPSEFQLRSGQEGRERFPFLYLDNEHAPYYQYRLREARTKRKAADTTVAAAPDSVQPLVRGTGISPERSPSHAIGGNRATETGRHVDSIELDRTCLSFNSVDGDESQINNYVQRDELIGNSHRTPCNRHSTVEDNMALYDTHAPRPEQPHGCERSATFARESSAGQQTGPNVSSEHPPSRCIPYGVLQEVHLLDSTGTERTGLNTYIILNNNDREEDEPLTAWLDLPSSEYPHQEPTYRLRPDTSTIFRAPHHRLLPVGFPLGAEVQQHDNAAASVVIRRTVEKGQRFYDVKDEFGDVYKDVPEEELRVHSNGCFDFRLPYQM